MASYPVEGTVRVWRPADAVGGVALDDGTEVKIGASACKGFVPLVGVRVRVLAAAPHPLGGTRASRVELAGDTRAYDSLVAAVTRMSVERRVLRADEFIDVNTARFRVTQASSGFVVLTRA